MLFIETMPSGTPHRCDPSIWCVSFAFLWPALSVSNSQFFVSAESGHIPAVTALLPLVNQVGHCQFWVVELAGMSRIDRLFSKDPTITPFSNSESSEQCGNIIATASIVVSNTIFNGGDRIAYQDRRYRRL